MNDETIGSDQDLWNEDWIKTRTWDVWTADGRLVETLAELREVFPDMSVEQLSRLPSMTAAPLALRRELGID